MNSKILGDGGKSRDKDNYAKLVQELREEFDRESQKTGRSRLLLTMAVPAGTEYVEKGYDIPKLNKHLDWFNILSYDYHSAYEPAVNHHAPLYSLEEEGEYNYDSDLNIVSYFKIPNKDIYKNKNSNFKIFRTRRLNTIWRLELRERNSSLEFQLMDDLILFTMQNQLTLVLQLMAPAIRVMLLVKRDIWLIMK